jgi:hypothetical protein
LPYPTAFANNALNCLLHLIWITVIRVWQDGCAREGRLPRSAIPDSEAAGRGRRKIAHKNIFDKAYRAHRPLYMQYQLCCDTRDRSWENWPFTITFILKERGPKYNGGTNLPMSRRTTSTSSETAILLGTALPASSIKYRFLGPRWR